MFYATLPKLNEQLTLCVSLLTVDHNVSLPTMCVTAIIWQAIKSEYTLLVQFLQFILHSLTHWSGRNEDIQLNQYVYMHLTTYFL